MPPMMTNKDVERHTGETYTYANFYKFQDEFWNVCMDCEIEERQAINEGFVITIVDNSQNRAMKRQVIYNPSNMRHNALARCLNVKGFLVVINCMF